MKLNAPKQGLFAAVLVVSFLLHSIIMMQNSLEYQDTARKSQGNLILSQLTSAVQLYLPAKDTVSIALIVNQFAEQPQVSNIQIFAADNTLLGSGGNNPTRFGLTLTQNIQLDNKPLGHIYLTMRRLNPGEVIRHQWFYFLLFALLHLLLWLIYRAVARPESSQINYQMAQEMLISQAQKAVDQSAAEKPAENAAETTAATTAATTASTLEPVENKDYKVVVRIAYTDPSQLLDTLSQGVSKPYYTLSQTLLTQAVNLLNKTSNTEFTATHIIQAFNQRGAAVGINGRTSDAMDYGVQLALLFNQLSEAVYHHHRQNHRFALFTQCVVSARQKSTRSAADLCEKLIGNAPKNGVLIHAPVVNAEHIKQQYTVYALKHLAIDAQFMAANIMGILDSNIKLTIDTACQKILDNEPE